MTEWEKDYCKKEEAFQASLKAVKPSLKKPSQKLLDTTLNPYENPYTDLPNLDTGKDGTKSQKKVKF